MGYIKGRYAQGACSLIAELWRLGISAAVGYHETRTRDDGQRVRVRDNTLRVSPHSPLTDEQRRVVPAEWAGFSVVVEEASHV